MPEKTLHEAIGDIADAIRAKTSSQETMTIEEMPGEIASIETGIIPTGTKSITANGNGIDVYNYASVNVNVPSVQPSGTIEIDDTGDYNVTNYATARVGIDCSQQISNEGSDYYDYQVAKGWTKTSAAIRDFTT